MLEEFETGEQIAGEHGITNSHPTLILTSLLVKFEGRTHPHHEVFKALRRLISPCELASNAKEPNFLAIS